MIVSVEAVDEADKPICASKIFLTSPVLVQLFAIFDSDTHAFAMSLFFVPCLSKSCSSDCWPKQPGARRRWMVTTEILRPESTRPGRLRHIKTHTVRRSNLGAIWELGQEKASVQNENDKVVIKTHCKHMYIGAIHFCKNV